METNRVHREFRARGKLETLGAGLLFFTIVSLQANETPGASTATIRPGYETYIRLLPAPLAPLEDAGDMLLANLLRLLPSGKHLPDHLRERDHEDFTWGFQWIPRSWTAFGWGRPTMLLGNQEQSHQGAPKPIGEKGTFQISRYPDLPAPFCWLPLYFAFTTPGGMHLRLGARWDDIDYYTQFPSIAMKDLTKKRKKAPAVSPEPLPPSLLELPTQTTEQRPG